MSYFLLSSEKPQQTVQPWRRGSSVSSHYQSHRGSKSQACRTMQNQFLLSPFNPFIATVSVEMWLKESCSYSPFLCPFPRIIRFYKVWDNTLKLRHVPKGPPRVLRSGQTDSRQPKRGHLALPYTGLGTRHTLSKSQHDTDLLTNISW